MIYSLSLQHATILRQNKEKRVKKEIYIERLLSLVRLHTSSIIELSPLAMEAVLSAGTSFSTFNTK